VSLKIVHLSLRPVAVVLCLMELDPLGSARGSPCGVLLGLAQFLSVPVDLALVSLGSGFHLVSKAGYEESRPLAF